MRDKRRTGSLLALLAASLVVAACGADPTEHRDTTAGAPPAAAPIPDRADPPARPRIVALGDSLTAGYGLSKSESYPAILQHRIDAKGYEFEVVNAGVSGDTSAGGLRRLDWALDGDVRILIVALGANDGLRGLPVDEMEKNLTEIVRRARARNIEVILAGMEAPPNYGSEYAGQFRQAYRDIAAREPVVFVPFLLDEVAGVSGLNQSDGIHPNVEGTRIVAETIWTVLQPLLDRMAAAS